MRTLYLQVDVWSKSVKNRTSLYRCFQDLSTKKYAVKVEEVFTMPITVKDFNDYFVRYLELVLDDDLDETLTWFDSLEEAIIEFDKSFE